MNSSGEVTIRESRGAGNILALTLKSKFFLIFQRTKFKVQRKLKEMQLSMSSSIFTSLEKQIFFYTVSFHYHKQNSY